MSHYLKNPCEFIPCKAGIIFTALPAKREEKEPQVHSSNHALPSAEVIVV
jgi:hypothetical protein